MNIQELKERLQNGETLDKIIEIKPYISFTIKKIMVEDILNVSLEIDDNGINRCDYFTKKLVTDVKIISEYTNINLDKEDIIEQYDFLVENKIIEYVYAQIDKNERYTIEEFLYDELHQRLEINNSVANVIAVGLDKLAKSIPDEKGIKKIFGEITKSVNKIKPDNLEILREIYNPKKS